MTDQSGAFPETLREAPWDSLIAVVTGYVSDRPVPGGDSDRAVVLAAIDRLRAALERPRPPERVHDDVTRSDHDGARASDVLGEAPERADTPSVAGDRTESEKERRVHYQDIVYGVLARLETLTGERNTQATREATIALLERALERPRPAPPEPSATFTARQTLESEPCNYCGEGAKVFFSLNPEAMPDICPACFVTALGFAEPDAETFTLLPKRSPGGSAGTGAAPTDTVESLVTWLNANDWWDFSTVELATRILKRLRGGAAQPPPSALTHEERDKWRSERNDLQRTLWCVLRAGGAVTIPDGLLRAYDPNRAVLEWAKEIDGVHYAAAELP